MLRTDNSESDREIKTRSALLGVCWSQISSNFFTRGIGKSRVFYRWTNTVTRLLYRRIAESDNGKSWIRCTLRIDLHIDNHAIKSLDRNRMQLDDHGVAC